jgi:hypothetical protein
MTSKRSFLSSAPAIVLALSLAGCGGGDADMQTSATDFSGPSGTPQSGSSPDAFIDRVMAVISNTSETAEPEDIGSITATKPEDVEPVPVS